VNNRAIEEAAGLLAEAAATGQLLHALPEGSRPGSAIEAHAIQAVLVERSGQALAGWKVAIDADGRANWGAIYARDSLESPATLDSRRMPMLGVEGEVAFRFVADLPAREQPYSRQEISAVLAPFPAIEIVDTRFASYANTPLLDRLADRNSNGGLILGRAEDGAGARDLSQLRVVLKRNGETIVDRIGGHPRKTPLLPVVAFVHARQGDTAFHESQVITAGTFTGIVYGKPGERYDLTFEGLGSANVEFT
jgi:2-keto-4-pentenoate hydratase